jgi:hypothetical protein
VIDTGIHRGAQDGNGLITVPGRAEDAVSGQLHRAVAHARNHLVG